MWFKLSTRSDQNDQIESERCMPPIKLLRAGLDVDTPVFALDELFDEEEISHFPEEVGRFVDVEERLYYLPSTELLHQDQVQCFHIRGVNRSLIDEAGVELWSSDQLCFETVSNSGRNQSSIMLSVIAEELDPNEVIAEAPISDLGVYADRVFKSQERISKLFDYSTKLGQSKGLAETLSLSHRFIFDLLPQATHIAIALSSNKNNSFPVALATKREGGEVNVPISRTLLQRVVANRSAILLTDVEDQIGGVMSVLAAGMKSTMVVPLWVGAEIIGVLQVDNRDKLSAFAREELELLTVAASNVSFAAETARLIERLESAEDQLKGGLSYMQTPDRAEASGLIGESQAMGQIMTQINRVKDLKVPVFINGETGTGKELIARALHYQSSRREKLFVAQNCGALPESILESELFGHVKGAFTGADRDKKGLFELADGGSVFLDEVGEMPLSLQAKLLRVLQEGEIRPLGSNQSKKINIRVISATHRHLKDMVSEGSFREDLFYRLHVFPISLPPLRDRGDDIYLLAHHFLRRYASEFGRDVDEISTKALQCLRAHAWPGNVRELQNEMQRAIISSFDDNIIEPRHLSPHIGGVDAEQADIMLEALTLEGTLKEMMEYLEKLLLSRALEEHANNKTKTAKALGITREGLHKKLTRYEMT